MIALLAKALGLKEVTTLAKWAVALVVFGLVVLLLLFAIGAMIFSEQARVIVIVIVASVVAVPFLRALWVRRNGETDAGERTIDGKVVPDKLAVAALDVPSRSPDGDYVLRGLPDYGKALLKLNSADFEYVPEIPEKVSDLPLVEPAVDIPRSGVPRWGIAAGATALLVVAGVVIYQASGGTAKASPAPIVDGRNSMAPAGSLQNYPSDPAAPQSVSSVPPPPMEIGPPPPDSLPPPPSEAKQAPARQRPPLEPPGTWRDVITELLWTRTDNGNEPLDWQGATDYCESLDVHGLTGWRLPKYYELNVAWGVKEDSTLPGGIQISRKSEFFWTSTLVGQDMGEGNDYSQVLLSIGDNKTHALPRSPIPDDLKKFGRAICVHNPIKS